MPALKITWYKTKAARLIKMFRIVPQKDMATLLNISQQTYSYRLRNVYPGQLEDLIRMLDAIGYEITEKEL